MRFFSQCTKHLAILTGEPQPGTGKVQIPNFAPAPVVNTASPLAASMADGLKALVRLYLDVSLGSLGCNRLIDNFDSTKRKISCYSWQGHRRPPLSRVCLGRQTIYFWELPDVHSVLMNQPTLTYFIHN